MVLAGSFESLLQPITVLTSIPLALVGVAIAMVPLGDPIGVMVNAWSDRVIGCGGQ